MADIPREAPRADPAERRNTAQVVNRAGAIVSIALVVGACVWGYRVLSRDVSGIPVVRALEGPMRVQPDNPGGRQAEHQGLAVNQVAADESSAKFADRLIVAPPPIALNAGDAVVTRTSVPIVSSEELTVEVAAPAQDPVTQELAAQKATAQETVAQNPIVAPAPLDIGKTMSVSELAAQLAAGATPLGGETVTAASVEPTPVKADLSPADTAEAAPNSTLTGGIKRSLRPVVRPVGLATSAPDAIELALASAAIDAAPTIIDAADIPAGTRMVQLGAFASPEVASAEWDKLLGKFDDYLGDKSRVIQRATSGGRVFYRLRAMGFETVSDARRLCSALKAENADCIPVTTR